MSCLLLPLVALAAFWLGRHTARPRGRHNPRPEFSGSMLTSTEPLRPAERLGLYWINTPDDQLADKIVSWRRPTPNKRKPKP